MRARRLLIFLFFATSEGSVLAAGGSVSSQPPDVTRLVVRAPMPEYPADAVNFHLYDTGIYLLRVQIKSGTVTQVLVGRSAGDRAFDIAAVKALIKWHFKPGAVPYRKIDSVRMSPPQTEHETLVKIPVTFKIKRPNQAMQRTAGRADA
jgi:TonB family protein